MKLLASIFLSLALCASLAFAQKYDSSHRDWSVYKHNGTCYIGSAPVKQAGNYSRRGQPYLLVVHRGANIDEINASSGYPFGKDTVKVTIDSNDYKMFTEGETAWAYDSAQDRQMVQAMLKGNKMSLKGKSTKGTYSEDTYSLMGFTAARNRMKALCR